MLISILCYFYVSKILNFNFGVKFINLLMVCIFCEVVGFPVLPSKIFKVLIFTLLAHLELIVLCMWGIKEFLFSK